IEAKAMQTLRECLKEVPFLEGPRIRREMADSLGLDLVAEVGSGETFTNLLVEVNANGEPRYARTAAFQLGRVVSQVPTGYGVFMAPYISPRTARLCEDEGIGYIDFAGNCRLAFDNVYIRREGQPNDNIKRKSLGAIYSPKASRVLRVLLGIPLRPWKLQDIASKGRVSIGHVSNVKKALIDRELARDTPDGLITSEPTEILQEWVREYLRYRSDRSSTRTFYSLLQPSEIEELLAKETGNARTQNDAPVPLDQPLVALTDFSGADRIAPFVRYQKVTAYARTGAVVDDLAKRLDLRAVETGANVEIITPYDESVFFGARIERGTWIVDPLQLYLDLSTRRARGEEAAEFVYNQHLRPGWNA
ncbi:MAG: type IV toxin-antitoxin system AbiEi family antitoxin, partial [Rhodothermia bacterium]